MKKLELVIDYNFDPEIKRIPGKFNVEIWTNIPPRKKDKKPRK